ncbi:MAG: transglycosylase domain-containing protein [Rhodospirillales bacterium]|nr:transglycosylase domain-containing protein [Rhodospirillales bacterium]
MRAKDRGAVPRVRHLRLPKPWNVTLPDRSAHLKHRALTRAVAALGALALLGAAAFALLLLLTPSARVAVALARDEALKHGIGYPGPPAPARFAEALVATEDHRFYSPVDPGIDPVAVLRVILGRITGHGGQGGSTIEQQLAKMLYTPGRTGPGVKLEQLALAVKLNFAYSKAEILSLYAEAAYYGDGYYGLRAASRGYFGVEPALLSWPEAAMLAGVVNAPALDDPRTHPAAARAREIHVFKRLVAVGDLTPAEAKAALSQPLGLIPRTRAARSLKGGSQAGRGQPAQPTIPPD